MQPENTAWLSVLLALPLFGAAAAYLIGQWGKRYAGIVATLAAGSAFAVTIVQMQNLPRGGVAEQTLFPWLILDTISLGFYLRFDQLTAVMCLVITGVGALIHLYAVGYMAHDEDRPRFFAYFNLFLFAMLLLVLGGNLAVLFAGWEGVGLCSYLLIGFWHKNPAFAAAGRKAFVVNRIGDAGFLLGMFLLLKYFGTLDFEALRHSVGCAGVPYGLICLLLFFGAAGKSAQIPLFVWLPDAMAGPTPVSALIHAATMVTAGVYLLARMNFLFALSPECMGLVVVVALVTALMAACIALVQNDIKKVLAYSTISQLGFMFMAAGAGVYWAAIFHLVTHAFFKACLFLGAGAVIHGCHHEQDMRKLGGLSRLMPWTFAAYLISVLAISGIFPFAGYYSKHAVLNALSQNPSGFVPDPVAVGVLASLTAFLTAFYMTRSLMLTFMGHYRGEAKPHAPMVVMIAPIVALAFLAAVGGVALGERLPEYLNQVLPAAGHQQGESILMGILNSWVGILGMLTGYLFYSRFSEWPSRVYRSSSPFGELFSARFYLNEIYAFILVRPLAGLSRALWRIVDQGLIDGAVNGTGAIADAGGEALRRFQTGLVNHYALYIFAAAAALIIWGLAV